MVYLIGIASLIAGVATLFSPFVGLLTLTAINLIVPGELYPVLGALHLERVIAILVMGAFLVHHRLTFPTLTRRVLIFWGTMFLSIPLSVWPSGALQSWTEFGKIVIYNVLIANLVTSEKRLKYFLLVFVLVIGYLAGSTYFSGLTRHTMNVDRVIGYTHTTDDPNALGMTLVSALPFALIFLADKKQGIFRAVILGCVLLSVWTVVETASRTSFFTLVLMIVIVALRSSKRMVLLPVGLIMLALIWTVMPAQYRDRYETVQSLEKDMSYQNRRIAWGAGVHMFFDRPLTGIGTGQFAVAAGTKYWPNTLGRRKIWLQPHSLYFQVIAELGLLGALAFGTLVFSAFRENLRLRRRLMELPDAAGWLRDLPSACLLCMALLLVAGYSGHNLYRQTWYFVFGITAAMFGILNKAKENELILPPLPTEDAMVGGAIMNDKSRARCMTLPSFIRMEGGVVAELPRPDTHP